MSLSTDQPKSTKNEDRFQRYDFSMRIANIVASNASGNSLVVGLYGKWGEGKTSVMNFIKHELPPECIAINFNPWLFNDQEHLIKAFFNDIAVSLKKSIAKPKENIGKILSDYGTLVSGIKIAGFGLSGLNVLGDKLKDVTVEKLKQRVDQVIKDSNKKIVVFVDDIDRLDAKEIQHLFKLIKLVGDFSNTAYVLAFDCDMVAGALAPLYGDGNKSTGYQFLEKIIQVPLTIPKATKTALVQYTIALLDEVVKGEKVTLTNEEINRFRNIFDENFVPAINNPRLAIRYANTLIFSLPLLSGEVAIIDLMLVEALKIFYPQAYDFMRLNSGLFLTDTMERGSFRPGALQKGTILSEIKQVLDKFEEKEQGRITTVWQELFPQYNHTTTDRGYIEDSWRNWYRSKRICSAKYFERYFTYAVLKGDISDVFFDQFLKELGQLDLAGAKEKMDLLFEQTTISDAIFKLRLWEDHLDEKQSELLGKLFASIGSDLPLDRAGTSFYPPRTEGARMIANLIINVGENKRAAVAIETFGFSSSLEFAMEINYWLLYKNEREISKFFTVPDMHSIQIYFVSRFKMEFTDDNFFTLLSDGNLWRILNWWNEENRDGLHRQLDSVINNEAERAISLIKVFAATIVSWDGLEGTQTYKGGFNEHRYDSMASLVDVQMIYSILNDLGSYRLHDVDLQSIDDQARMTNNEIANVFMQFYEKKHLTLGDI